MIIKVSSKEDCAICDKFLTLLIQDERKYDSTIDEKFIVQDYFINMLNNQNILLLYEIKNVKVGYIFAKKIDNKYLIDGLYVDQNYKNNKIATELLKEVIKEIYSFGSYQIFINVIKENEIAVNLYKNVGFVIVEENELKYSMVYKEYRLIDASINDIERLKKYKLKTIFEYVKDLELSEKDKIISTIESKTKDILLLTRLYKFYGKKEKLWNLLIDSNYRYLLLDNIEILKDKYNDELYSHFINEFYNILKEGKSRDIYNKSSKYIKAISRLNNGEELVENVIIDLKSSDYQKCSALFDEINNALKN